MALGIPFRDKEKAEVPLNVGVSQVMATQVVVTEEAPLAEAVAAPSSTLTLRPPLSGAEGGANPLRSKGNKEVPLNVGVS